jgi:hypothetical protein
MRLAADFRRAFARRAAAIYVEKTPRDLANGACDPPGAANAHPFLFLSVIRVAGAAPTNAFSLRETALRAGFREQY